MKYRRPESVLVLVCTTAGEVLLLNRVNPSPFWQSVTGSLEDGESPEQAAHRELQEETGIIDASLVDWQMQNRFEIREPWRRRYAPDVTHNTEHVFLCSLERKPSTITIAPEEHSEYRWLTVARAIEKVSSETNRKALLKLRESDC